MCPTRRCRPHSQSSQPLPPDSRSEQFALSCVPTVMHCLVQKPEERGCFLLWLFHDHELRSSWGSDSKLTNHITILVKRGYCFLFSMSTMSESPLRKAEVKSSGECGASITSPSASSRPTVSPVCPACFQVLFPEIVCQSMVTRSLPSMVQCPHQPLSSLRLRISDQSDHRHSISNVTGHTNSLGVIARKLTLEPKHFKPLLLKMSLEDGKVFLVALKYKAS